MRIFTFFLLGLLVTTTAYTQYREFTIHSNGLIYSDHTMNQLSSIVDSLNLQFKNCDFSTVFNAPCQALGHYIELKDVDLIQARKDMDNLMSFDDFLDKYPETEVVKDVLVFRTFGKNYRGEDILIFEDFGEKRSSRLYFATEEVERYQENLNNTWLYEYIGRDIESPATLYAFYFLEDFQSNSLQPKYSEMIGYADCLIDVSSLKIHKNATESWAWEGLPKDWRTYSKEKQEELLEEQRCIEVIGNCSMDISPREHAIGIALLSAETHNWGVFLKAHLDIMNDNFARITDGSYAWEERETYIKELEELNINVLDLMLGIIFRIENPVENHYFGSIGRVGRALSETKFKEEVEEEILSVISDTQLDYFNRILFINLFRSYNYYLQNEALKSENKSRLITALNSFPETMRERFVEELHKDR